MATFASHPTARLHCRAVAEIVLDKVRKEFAAGVVAVNDVELTIGDGEFMVLVGPSGCGKTTLLRSIGDRNLFVARVNARTHARAGEPLTLAIDPSQLYFFSPDTGESLLGGRAAVTSAA